jgi:hypothetical protein
MKIDEVVMHNLLRTYGNPLRVRTDSVDKSKRQNRDQIPQQGTQQSPQQTGFGYDQNGQITISAEKKQALIDFFQ